VNTYFIELESRTNLCQQADIAEQLGVRLSTGGPLNRVPTFAIGSNEVTPLAMAGAYAAFANHGIYCPPTPVIEIRDRRGQIVDFPRPQCTRVLNRDVADTLTAILTRVIDGPVERRTGRSMTLDRPAAGKTGTTNDSAAVWFCGFTPDLAGAVWVGDPRGGYRYPMKDVTINGVYYEQVFGSSMPGPIWKAAMLGALEGSAPVGFDLVNQWGLGPARDVYGNYSDDGSLGPPIAVPRTIGLSEKDATDLLEYAGFKVKVDYQEVVGPVGIVLDQDPVANRMLPRNTKVTITVSKEVPPSPQPSDSATPTPDPSVTPTDSATPDPSSVPSPSITDSATP
jgi:membrane peptidoglycan carboxypeptidase